ncbi:MAG: hypothetical protein H6Q95_376 [Nitrospirae bacterium]|nr:hypothetical protein [Nitrospirota bacterium]
MFVEEGKNLFRQLDNYGSRCKVSVVRPVFGNMPDLTFMAPTCKTGIQVFFQHGKVGYFILQLRFIIQLLALTVRVFLGMDNYKNIVQIFKPRGRYSECLSSFKIQPVSDELNEVDRIDLKYSAIYPAV